MDRDELIRKLAFDVFANRELFSMLTNNEKISYDPATKTFTYKPTYNIRTKEDLLQLLKENREFGGMEAKELKDSYADLNTAIKELEEAGQIIVIRNKDNAPKLLYPNEPSLSIKISEEPGVLTSELEKAGLKTMEVFSTRPKTQNKAKGKSRRGNRKMKITNTHLEGIDLTKEFVAPK
ncbi:hypothetical protein HK102_000039 [Quaeritorhiza haematococci]|nr:hypothetical protein HK102_000039 [Quaeritorhiza haematococci]